MSWACWAPRLWLVSSNGTQTRNCSCKKNPHTQRTLRLVSPVTSSSLLFLKISSSTWPSSVERERKKCFNHNTDFFCTGRYICTHFKPAGQGNQPWLLGNHWNSNWTQSCICLCWSIPVSLPIQNYNDKHRLWKWMYENVHTEKHVVVIVLFTNTLKVHKGRFAYM